MCPMGHDYCKRRRAPAGNVPLITKNVCYKPGWRVRVARLHARIVVLHRCRFLWMRSFCLDAL